MQRTKIKSLSHTIIKITDEEKASKPFCSSLCNEREEVSTEKVSEHIKIIFIKSADDLCINRVELLLALL